MSILTRAWRWITGTCRYCGCDETLYEETPDKERPHWRIFCKECGKRRADLDGFSDRVFG